MKSRYFFLAIYFLCVAQVFAQPIKPPKDTSFSSLHFVTQPPLTGQKDIPYLYTAKAISNDSTAIIRYGSRIPFTNVMPARDLTIDSVTGVVTWTPKMKGWYSIELFALDDKKEIAVQPFGVCVTGGNGIVRGNVTDTLGNGIPNVIIELLQASSPATAIAGCFSYTTMTNSSGNYRISGVDPGNYKLHAISPTRSLNSQWYDGKKDASEANVITVADTPAVSIANFVLRAGALRQKDVTVSGSVTDSISTPIAHADVFLVQSGFALNTNSTVDDFRQFFDLNEGHSDCKLEGNSDYVFHATVDSTGHYTLRIPKGSYIAFSKAPGYAIEYFDGKTDLLSATQLDIQQDTSNINFTLSSLPPVVLGSISGSVFDSTNIIGVAARIIVIRDRWTSPDEFKIAPSYVVDTDSLGNFTADHLLPGSYFVFALPLGSYAPAFYSTDTMNIRWKKATKIDIHGNTVTGITIYVHKIPASSIGFAAITGTVRDNSSSSFVPGTMVYALLNNVIAGYGITDASGNYTIAGLAPGSYTVSVENPGYSEAGTQSVSVSYSPAGVPLSATANLSVNQITAVKQETTVSQPTSFELGQNYPNPFNPSTTIQYSLATSSSISLKVYNIIGQEVATLVSGYQTAGTYQVVFDGRGFASGIYFYRLHSQSTNLTKKMLLLQ